MLVYHIIIAAVLLFVAWLWRQPEMQELINRVCAPIAEALNNDEYKDEMIQRCIKDFYGMKEKILESTSMAEVESWYWEVDVFHNAYVNNVPDQLLNDNADKLYDTCHQMRQKLQKPVVVFDNPEISLS